MFCKCQWNVRITKSNVFVVGEIGVQVAKNAFAIIVKTQSVMTQDSNFDVLGVVAKLNVFVAAEITVLTAKHQFAKTAKTRKTGRTAKNHNKFTCRL